MYFNLKIPLEEFKKLLLVIGEEGASYIKEEDAKVVKSKVKAIVKEESSDPENENTELNNPFPENLIFDLNIKIEKIQQLFTKIGEEGAHYFTEEDEKTKAKSKFAKKEESETIEETEQNELNNPFPETLIFDLNIKIEKIQQLFTKIGEEGASYFTEEDEKAKAKSKFAKKEESETIEETEQNELNNPFPETLIFDLNIKIEKMQGLFSKIGEEGDSYFTEEDEKAKAKSKFAKKEESETSDETEQYELNNPYPETLTMAIDLSEEKLMHFLEHIADEGLKYQEEEDEIKSKSKYKKAPTNEQSDAPAVNPFPELAASNPFPDAPTSGDNNNQEFDVDLNDDDLDEFFNNDEENSFL